MKVESCRTGVMFCHSACVVVLGVGDDNEVRGPGALEGVHCGSEVRVWCARWFVLHSGRACCCVLPSIRVVDSLLRGGGVEFVLYSEVWCEVSVVARDFTRFLHLGGSSARLRVGRGTSPTSYRMFVRVKGVYCVLVVLC